MHVAVWKKITFCLCTLFAAAWVLYLAYIVFSGHFIYTFTDIVLLCFLVYAPLLLGIMIVFHCGKKLLRNIWKLALYICLVFHCILLYGLLFRNFFIDVGGSATGVNLIPFRSILFKLHMGITLSRLVYQVFLFIPLALNLLLLYVQFERGSVYWGCMIFITTLIEFLQFIFRIGYCNIDDIILSMLGCFFLYISWKAIPEEQKLMQLRGDCVEQFYHE